MENKIKIKLTKKDIKQLKKDGHLTIYLEIPINVEVYEDD